MKIGNITIISGLSFAMTMNMTIVRGLPYAMKVEVLSESFMECDDGYDDESFQDENQPPEG